MTSSCSSTWYVHHLNNKGCVSVINGDYLAANNLIELALQKHRQISELGISPSVQSPSAQSPPLSSQLVEGEELHEGRQFCEDSVDSETDLDVDDHDSDGSSSVDAHIFRIQRISTNSKLRTVSFPGQNQEEVEHHLQGRQRKHQGSVASNPRTYHQVYRLPIAMSEEEWKTASIKDITFVLIFNAGLSNHLMGMDLLEKKSLQHGSQRHNESRHNRKHRLHDQFCQRYFRVARSMYRLGMDTLFSFVRGVDKIYYAAIFNNISHVCKTLEGNESPDAYWYDRQLLKSIYWWKDSYRTATSLQPPTMNSLGASRAHHQGTLHLPPPAPSSGLRTTTSNTSGDVTINDGYNEDDSEVIDAFLENVFYLIAGRKEWLPATAA